MRTLPLVLVAICWLTLQTNAQTIVSLTDSSVELMSNGRFEEARCSLDKATTLSPNNGKAYFLKGKICSAQQKDAEALAYFNKAIKLGFESGELYRLKGISEHLSGNKEQACRDFDRGMDLGDVYSLDMKGRFCR